MKKFAIEFVSGVEVEVVGSDLSNVEDSLLEMGFSSRDIASANVIELA